MKTQHNRAWIKKRNKRRFHNKQVAMWPMKPQWGLATIIDYVFNPKQKSRQERRKDR